MLICTRLNDMDVVDVIDGWNEIQKRIDQLNRQRSSVYNDKDTIRDMYLIGSGIPDLCREIIRLRQYVPADRRYPYEQ